MIPIDFSKVSSVPLRPSTKFFTYQNDQVVKVLTSTNQNQLLSNMEEVVKNSNHTHSNIVSCAGYNAQDADVTHTKLYILYPSLKHSLADVMEQHIRRKTRFTTEELLQYCDGLLSAAEYLEEQGITHQNIKPQNILFDGFNLLKLSEMGSGSVEKLKVLNSFFVAPEISQKPHLTEEQWHKADVWSVGMVMLEMYDFHSTTTNMSTKDIHTAFSYSDITFSEINSRIQNVRQIPKVGIELSEILSLMLNSDSESRPTFRQLKWLFFDKVSSRTGDAFQAENLAQSDDSLQDSNGDEAPGDSSDAGQENEILLSFDRSEESKGEDNIFSKALKESQQAFYDIFFAKFLHHFNLTPQNQNGLLINMRSQQQKNKGPGRQPNFQTLIPNTQTITVKSVAVTDDSLSILSAGLLLFSSVSSLTLDFRDAKISDKGLIRLFDFCLGHFKNLKIFYLWTTSPEVSDKSISFLARGPLSRMTGLRTLFFSLPKSQITDVMFDELREPLMRMKDLISLSFWIQNTKITDASIKMLCSQVLYHKTELQTLSLCINSTNTTNVSVQEITYVVLPRLKKLKKLYFHIGFLAITEDVLSNLFKFGLANLSNLELIHLGLTCVKSLGDPLLDQLVEVGLNNKPNLSQINIYLTGTKITNKSFVDIFYKLLPRLDLQSFVTTAKSTKVDKNAIEQVKHLPFFSKCNITI